MADKQRAYALRVDNASTDEDLSAEFDLPVDSEHKARKLKIHSTKQPHMRAFHLAWVSFFVCFTSTFAAPPLIPTIRDCLDLTKRDIGNAGMASLVGAIFSRLVLGVLCDLFGPRYAAALLIILTAPSVFCMAVVDTPTGFVVARFVIGSSLGTFVTCQFWMSSMFNPRIVGLANGVSAGWGNMGGGATQLLMPVVYHIMLAVIGSHEPFTAWRMAFFVPGMLHVVTGIALLALGQDLPDGNYETLHSSGRRIQDSLPKVIWVAVKNYRSWILAFTYGYCFGAQLTIDNIIAEYFYDKFSLALHTAGIIASSSGLLNIFSRPCGGILSDLVAHKFGMRGRLWALWIMQTLGGLFFIALGKTYTLGGAICVLLVLSIFIQASCGLTFGIVPFVSQRGLGVVSGMTAAGGNIGGVLTILLFFTDPAYSSESGLVDMGIMIVCCTLPVALIYFPQWGGMLASAYEDEDHTEEKYYGDEWSESEKQGGAQKSSMKFARNTRGERGKQKPIVPSSLACPPQGGCPIAA